MANASEIFLSDNRHFTIDYMHGDTVWFIINTDTWDMEDKIQPLQYYCAQLNASIPKDYDKIKQYKAYNVAQSNPCFEIRLYYHFYNEIPEEDSVAKIRK